MTIQAIEMWVSGHPEGSEARRASDKRQDTRRNQKQRILFVEEMRMVIRGMLATQKHSNASGLT
jgi:hypothetical protein